MEHLPINLNIKGRTVVICGGGPMAARRAELALRAGAQVKLFARELSQDFTQIPELRHIEPITRPMQEADLEGAALAFGTTEDAARDAEICAMARRAGVPVNIPDQPELCDFIMPAILDRSPLVISVSTSGASPILARIIRARLETLYPASFGRLTKFVGRFRDSVLQRITDGARRLRFWERILEGPVADLALAGDEQTAEDMLRQEIDAEAGNHDTPTMGEVYLVGAGPGDPDLLTFRALRLLQRADVVLYDRLIGQGLLNLVRRDAERIYVGKLPQDHTVPQEDLSQMLARLAKQGKRVLRLKGGDPFIFGRGGEEIEVLAAQGIPFQVVPGITAAAGCASYAGIPLTHRDHAQACTFVTGHGKNGEVDLDWKALIQPGHTVCVYMGLGQMPGLTRAFIEHGAAPSLPVAVVDNGTRRHQKVVTGTLETICEKVAKADLKGPAIIIIGTVVTLHDKLAWFQPDRHERSLGITPDADALPAQ